jgi:hypothetical protein
MYTKRILLFTIVTQILILNLYAQQTQQSIKVAGNCGMCKKRIEEAAIKGGASKADWDKKSQMLKISYDPIGGASPDQIKNSIAEAGHDNETYQAKEEAYQQLHECCKYKRNGTTDSTAKSCKESKKCKSHKKCCQKNNEKKCHPDQAKSSCINEKTEKKKGCCKDH